MTRRHSTFDVASLTDSIMLVMGKEFRKIETNISEERHIPEIDFISVNDMTNRVMMAIDKVMRDALIFTYQDKKFHEVRPTVQMIVAAALTDRVSPPVNQTRPLVEVMVASIVADHAAVLAMRDALPQPRVCK